MSLLLIHLAATWALVGLIWFVQLVHYPLFSAVAPERFATFEAEHSRHAVQKCNFIVYDQDGLGHLDPPATHRGNG